MSAKTFKFVPFSISTGLFLSSIFLVGPRTCLPGFCTDMHKAICFDSASECGRFITMVESLLNYELGHDLDVIDFEILSE